MTEELKQQLETKFRFRLNKNQWKDIKRLFYEIRRRDNIGYEDIIKELKKNASIQKAEGKNKFFVIKRDLINMRFPLTSKNEIIDTKRVFLTEIKEPYPENYKCSPPFTPETVYVEENAKGSYLEKRFRDKFPDTNIEIIDYYSNYIKSHKFSPGELKKPLIFIVKENWDFIKPCPCTKGHLGCNYWIFNLGMGCPFDCSYCFLQAYSNFPGIILPSNLNDFFNKFDNFYKKINRKIRIGTGEFCDSLALDDITGYSPRLIDFFNDKNVYFEFKTKSGNINNILSSKPSPNIIISWSLNPQIMVEKEEMCSVSLERRLEAAKKVRDKGFPVAFHFDPIIHTSGWENLYKNVVDMLYQEIKPPFMWISLGTLRGPRQLKNVAERRFKDSNIFYGELLIGKDKKLRYPEFIRKQIYKNMVKWIRTHDAKTPVYLCMEDEDTWSVMDKPFTSSMEIEKYLISP